MDSICSQFYTNYNSIPKICSSLQSFNPDLLTLTNGKRYYIAQ